MVAVFLPPFHHRPKLIHYLPPPRPAQPFHSILSRSTHDGSACGSRQARDALEASPSPGFDALGALSQVYLPSLQCLTLTNMAASALGFIFVLCRRQRWSKWLSIHWTSSRKKGVRLLRWTRRGSPPGRRHRQQPHSLQSLNCRYASL